MIFLCESRNIRRVKPGGGQRSIVACAAYRAGEKLFDERTDRTADFTKRKVLHNEIITPDGIPPPERRGLWNMAEAKEKRADSRTGHEFILGLDPRLVLEQNLDMARSFAKEMARRYGCAVDIAIHPASARGDKRNLHSHVLMTTRKIQTDGTLGEKTELEQSDAALRKKGKPCGREQITSIRELWQEIVNKKLADLGYSDRVDCRTNAEQLREKQIAQLEEAAKAAQAELDRRSAAERERKKKEDDRAKQAEPADKATATLRAFIRALASEKKWNSDNPQYRASPPALRALVRDVRQAADPEKMIEERTATWRQQCDLVGSVQAYADRGGKTGNPAAVIEAYKTAKNAKEEADRQAGARQKAPFPQRRNENVER